MVMSNAELVLLGSMPTLLFVRARLLSASTSRPAPPAPPGPPSSQASSSASSPDEDDCGGNHPPRVMTTATPLHRLSWGRGGERVPERFDVIIIASGAGGTLAHTLAPSGKEDPSPRARQLPVPRDRELEPGRGLRR